jgi:hypothetical protein
MVRRFAAAKLFAANLGLVISALENGHKAAVNGQYSVAKPT